MGKEKHMTDPADWKFNRNRKGDDHIHNCDSGYLKGPSSATEGAQLVLGERTSPARIVYGGKARSIVEVHHLLCVHACSDATLPEGVASDAAKREFIRKSLAITDWNINCRDNNIGLPRKWIYVIDVQNHTGWGKLPCHQVDHDMYLNSVKDWVTTEIWNKMLQNKTDSNCENMQGSAVVKLFEKGSSTWRKHLNKRGRKYGGTKASLDYCIEGPQDPVREANWYIPFSMAELESEVRPRAKPPIIKGSVQRKNLLAMEIR